MKQVSLTDIQFSQVYEGEKLRRLVDDLRNLETSLNGVIKAVNAGGTGGGGGVSEHVLATETGLGSLHTVSGLLPGQVLRATSAISAAFQYLAFTDLTQTDFSAYANGDVMQFIDGYWTNRQLQSLSSVTDPGADALLSWNNSMHALSWLQPGAGLMFSGGYLVVNPGGIPHSGLAGLGNDDHPQYGNINQVEVILQQWIFALGASFLGNVALTANFGMASASPEMDFQATDSDVDTGAWRVEFFPGMQKGTALADDGSELEDWYQVSRTADGLIDNVNYSGGSFTYNGANVLTDETVATVLTNWTWAGVEPRILFRATGGGNGGKLWDFDVTPTLMAWRTRTDADGAGFNVISATRTANSTTITGISFGQAAVTISYSFQGAGSVFGQQFAGGSASPGASAGIYANSTAPSIAWRASGSGTDAKVWDSNVSGNVWRLRPFSDAGSGGANALAITRAANVVSLLELGNATDNPAVTLLGTGQFTTGGGHKRKLTALVANATLSTVHDIVTVDATTGNITITLPAIATSPGFCYTVKKIDVSANTVTLDANASETIDGALTKVLSAQYASVNIVAGATEWHVV